MYRLVTFGTIRAKGVSSNPSIAKPTEKVSTGRDSICAIRAVIPDEDLDAARQEGAERDVGDKAAADCVVEPLDQLAAKLVDRTVLVTGIDRCEPPIPTS